MLMARLRTAAEAGELPAELVTRFERDALLDAHLRDRHGQRTGFVWLTPNRSALRESTGVFRFFQRWAVMTPRSAWTAVSPLP
jgi:hypothetical protein